MGGGDSSKVLPVRDLFPETRSVRAVVWFLISILLIGMLFWWAGPTEIVSHLSTSDPVYIGLALSTSFGATISRAAAAERLFWATHERVARWRFYILYLLGNLPRTLFAAGTAGAATVVAYALYRDQGYEFNSTLATFLTAEAVNTIASMILVVSGLVFLSVFYVDPFGSGTVGIVMVGTAVSVGSGLVLIIFWANRAKELLLWSLATAGQVGRLVPLSGYIRGFFPSWEMQSAIERFFGTISSLSASRRTMVIAGGFALVSYFGSALSLYFALGAVGVSATVPAAIVAAHLGGLAGLVPVPGGLGSIEVAVAGLLVLIVGIDPPTATSAALLFRLATYWFELSLGGGSVLYLVTDF